MCRLTKVISMVQIELKKLKRKKLLLILFIVCLISSLIQYGMGNMTYNDIKYGSTFGWFLKNGLSVNSYYIFTPIFTLIGMELFLMESRDKVWNNLLTSPIKIEDIVKSKKSVSLILSLIYSLLTFLLMLFFEIKLNLESINSNVVIQYFIKYMIHALVSYLISWLIISVMLYFKQNLQIGVIVGFVVSFFGVFVSQLNMAYLYVVNSMFYISKAIDSTNKEKLISAIIVLLVFMLQKIILSKYCEKIYE